jgi:Protein of unknown function (DUF3107)
VDVRIGLVQSIRELELELPDDTDVATLKADVAKVLADDDAVIWLTDKKGTQVALAGGKVTFISIGSADTKGRIGFGG